MVKKIVIGLVVLILVIFFGVSWYFTSMLLYPPVGKCRTEHFVYCKDPSEINVQFRNVSFQSTDGKNLKGWYMPSGNSNKAIIMVHGRGASRYEGMRWVKPLVRSGFNVLTFDLRDSGESEQGFNSMGYYEQKDVIGAINFLTEKQGAEKIGIFGVSMGAVTGIGAMAKDKRIRAGIFEAGFANFSDLIAHFAKRDFGLPRYPLIPLVVFIYELRGDIDTDMINAEELIGKISPRPVFIIHCPDDDYVPYKFGKRIFKAAGEPKLMWSAPCNKHAEAWQSNPRVAENKVVSFFEQNL